MPADLAADNVDGLLAADHGQSGQPETGASPEVALWAAVVLNTWRDAFEFSDKFLAVSESAAKRASFDPELIRGDARRWLVSDIAAWKAAREEVCDLAGICPDLIQSAAKRRIELCRQEDAEREAAAAEIARHRIDTALAALLEKVPDLAPGRVDQRLYQIAEMEEMVV